jgi:hypothetical protein
MPSGRAILSAVPARVVAHSLLLVIWVASRRARSAGVLRVPSLVQRRRRVNVLVLHLRTFKVTNTTCLSRLAQTGHQQLGYPQRMHAYDMPLSADTKFFKLNGRLGERVRLSLRDCKSPLCDRSASV